MRGPHRRYNPLLDEWVLCSPHRLDRPWQGQVEDVADEGFEACMAGEVIRVPGVLNRAGVVAGRATPKWLLRKLSGALVRRLK